MSGGITLRVELGLESGPVHARLHGDHGVVGIDRDDLVEAAQVDGHFGADRDGAAENARTVAEGNELDAKPARRGNDPLHLPGRTGPQHQARQHAGKPVLALAEIGEGQPVVRIGAPGVLLAQHVLRPHDTREFSLDLIQCRMRRCLGLRTRHKFPFLTDNSECTFVTF